MSGGFSTGSLEASDAAAAAVQKTPNRVTLESLKEQVASMEYYYPSHTPEMTICALKLKNGFTVIGESASADPANFDAELGRKFAFENALRKVWPLEGYLLRDRLARGAA